MKILVVGNTTADYIFNSSSVRIGGPPYYIVAALRHIDITPTVLTSIGSDYFRFIKTLSKFANDIAIVKCNTTTTFEIYLKDGGRVLKLKERGCKLDKALNKLLASSQWDLAIVSTVYDELGFESVFALRKHVNVLAFDIQGFSRRVIDNGRIVSIVDNTINKIIREADIVHAGIDDVKDICPSEERVKCLRESLSLPKIALTVTEGKSGAYLVLRDGSIYSIEALKNIEGNDVGAGDIFTAIMAVSYVLGDDIFTATRKASVAAALKVSRDAFPWFTSSELETISYKANITKINV